MKEETQEMMEKEGRGAEGVCRSFTMKRGRRRRAKEARRWRRREDGDGRKKERRRSGRSRE